MKLFQFNRPDTFADGYAIVVHENAAAASRLLDERYPKHGMIPCTGNNHVTIDGTAVDLSKPRILAFSAGGT